MRIRESDEGIDMRRVRGKGKEGRIKNEELDEFLKMERGEDKEI